MFLGKTLYCHSASLHPGLYIANSEFILGDNPLVDKSLGWNVGAGVKCRISNGFVQIALFSLGTLVFNNYFLAEP